MKWRPMALTCRCKGGAAGGGRDMAWTARIPLAPSSRSCPTAFVLDTPLLPGLALMGCEMHDRERDPGHYIDLADDGKAMGVVPLDKLPTTREAYDIQRRAGGSTQYKAGYLAY